MTQEVGRSFFYDDYSDGAHPAIVAAVVAANASPERAYGLDRHSEQGADRLRGALGVDADVHFVASGTMANLLTIAAMLRPYEGIIAAATAHIATSETGAIEATGHKVVTVTGEDGKLTRELVDLGMRTHRNEHTVKPAAVFLSQGTEVGTVYTLDELCAVVDHAHSLGLRVLLDGARLAMAAASEKACMTLRDVGASGVDAVVVGGTKNGGLCGEAVVLIDPDLRPAFRYLIKQRGAMVAKGRFLGAQFARFFAEDGLWLSLGAQANQTARHLADGLAAVGHEPVFTREINHVFCALDPDVVVALEADFGFHRRWPTADGRMVVRFVCSWATTVEQVDALVARLAELTTS